MDVSSAMKGGLTRLSLIGPHPARMSGHCHTVSPGRNPCPAGDGGSEHRDVHVVVVVGGVAAAVGHEAPAGSVVDALTPDHVLDAELVPVLQDPGGDLVAELE